ncbi:hypothetical protein NKH77_49660 [Streptomyces sp. M19]
MAAVRAGAAPVLERVTRGGEHYTVRTARRGSSVVQAAYGERFQRAERKHLLLAFGAAEALGLLLVAVASGMLARRAMTRCRRRWSGSAGSSRTPATNCAPADPVAHPRPTAGPPVRHRDPDELSTDLQRLVTGTRQLGDIIDDLLLSARLSRSPGSPSRSISRRSRRRRWRRRTRGR